MLPGPPPQQAPQHDQSAPAGSALVQGRAAGNPPALWAPGGPPQQLLSTATAVPTGAAAALRQGPPTTWQGPHTTEQGASVAGYRLPSAGQGPPIVGQTPLTTPQPYPTAGQGPLSAAQAPSITGHGPSTTGRGSAAAWHGPAGAWQAPPSAVHRGPTSTTSGYVDDETSLLIDLEDIADVFGQNTSPLPPGRPQWEPEGPPQGPPQAPPQEGPHGLPQEAPRVPLWGAPPKGLPQGPSQGKPENEPQASYEAFAGSSHLRGSCPGVPTLARNLPIPAAVGDPASASAGFGIAASLDNQDKLAGEDGEGAPFWLFGAVLDARSGTKKGKEWELLVTDGMRMFLAVAGRAVGERMLINVKQTSLFSPIPAIEQLKTVQGHFLLDVKGGNEGEQQVHVLSFRASAPGHEVTEKLKYLYTAITGEET